MKYRFFFTILLTMTLIIILNIFSYLLLVNYSANTLMGLEDDNLGGYLHSKNWLGNNLAHVIFLGDSRTKYHVDTYWMNQRGMKAYNAGISGQFIEIWPTAVRHLAAYHPKYIILGVTLDELYSPLHINTARSIGITDIKLLLTTKQPTHVLKDALKALINFSLPITYLNRILTEYLYSFLGKSFQYTYVNGVNCNAVKKYEYKGGDIILCNNGDGVMTSAIKDADLPGDLEELNLASPNMDTIRYLNEVINMIKSKGVKPVVVLIPHYHKKFYFNKVVLEYINAPVIDFTNRFIEDKHKGLWANSSHFNDKGREIYTKALYAELRKVLV